MSNKIQGFLELLEKEPNNYNIYNKIGSIYLLENNLDAAKTNFEQALEIHPQDINALSNLGICYIKGGHKKLAQKIFNRALEVSPNNANLCNNMGTFLYSENKPQEAIVYFKKVLDINPKFIDVYNNLAAALIKVKNKKEALLYCKQGYDLDPSNINILISYAKMLLHFGKDYQCENIINQALEIDPDNFSALKVLADRYIRMKSDKVEKLIERCVAINPNDHELYYLQAMLYYKKNKFEDAISYFEKSLSSNNNSIHVLGDMGKCYLAIADWKNFTKISNQAKSILYSNQYFEPLVPFSAQILFPDLKDYLKMCNIWGQYYEEKQFIPKFKRTKYKHKKLKIGYISPDFKNHPVGLLINDLFSRHNRQKFEIYGFATLKSTTELYFNICKSFDYLQELHDCSPYPDFAIDAIRNKEIDILIDLTGTTAHDNYNILSCQPAPVQCHMLGVTGTLGTNFIQYIITTETVAPEEMLPYYKETVVYLPQTEISRTGFSIPNKTISKSEYDLPEDSVVFLSFHAYYRIDEEIFSTWMKILYQVPNAVLWLKPSNSNNFRKKIKSFAKEYGIDPERIIFNFKDNILTKNWQNRLADLYLDTFGFTSGTCTVINAWAGVPTLTCLGPTPQSRVAASYCFASGVPEQVVYSKEEYITTAIDWATHPEKLKTIKNKLLQARSSSALFSPNLYIKNLETGLEKIWDHFVNGSSAKCIYVGGKNV